MEHEPRDFQEGEQLIDPQKAIISDAEMAADAATGSAEARQLQTQAPLVTAEEHEAENPHSG